MTAKQNIKTTGTLMYDSTRRTFLATLSKSVLAASGTSLLSSPRSVAAPAAAKKPNFVFFLIDDLGWADVGCYGSQFYETPNVDRLASMGMRFTDGYAACTVCSPTRASIMTGKYPARLHLTDWIAGHRRPHAKLSIPDWHKQLDHEEVTIPEALKPLGYSTGFIGKWHLGPEGFWPDSQGFDVNVGGYSRGQPPSYFAPYRIPTMKEGPKGEYLTDRHADDAEAFLDAHAAKPFFLYVSMYAVHTPLQAKKELIEKYDAKAKANPDYPQRNPVYGGMVHSMDECVGRVLRKLESLKLMDTTVIMFTGDNGGLIGNPRNPITSNKPLRAGKGSAYEGGVREPFIVYWPGVTKPGSTCAEPVISNDFYPTVLDIAGADGDAQHNAAVDGTTLVPLLKGNASLGRAAIYWHYPHYHPGGATPYGAVRCGDLKLIEFFEDNHVEMYNLRDDIGEANDLAAAMPDKAAELRNQLHTWREAVGAQMPTPNPQYESEKPNGKRSGNEPGPKVERKDGTHPDYAIFRDCTVKPSDFGIEFTSAAEGTAMRKLDKPLTKRAVFRVKMKSRLKREEGWQNGFIALGDSGKDAELVVAGLYIGGLNISIFDGLSDSGLKTSLGAEFDRDAVHELTVTVDFGKRTVEATAFGTTVTRPLPQSVKAIRYVGYHVMQTTTAFSEIGIEGE